MREEWFRSAQVRAYLRLDDNEFIVMPNHIHGIMWIKQGAEGDPPSDDIGARRRRAPTTERFGAPVSGSIPTIVRALKSATTRRINQLRGTRGESVWQRNYYEHLIRDEKQLARIRQYIMDNPSQWEIDRENPEVRLDRPLPTGADEP